MEKRQINSDFTRLSHYATNSQKTQAKTVIIPAFVTEVVMINIDSSDIAPLSCRYFQLISQRGYNHMLRREFFGAAAGVATVSPAALSRPKVDALAREIESAMMAELPGVKRVQVTYDPANEKVPLMILAFRV